MSEIQVLTVRQTAEILQSRPENDAWGREMDRVSRAMRADAQAAGLTEQNAEERIAQAVDHTRGGIFRMPALSSSGASML